MVWGLMFWKVMEVAVMVVRMVVRKVVRAKRVVDGCILGLVWGFDIYIYMYWMRICVVSSCWDWCFGCELLIYICIG